MSTLTVPDPPCGRQDCAELLAHLVKAIEGRDAIGMAKGILMHAEGIDAAEAFQVLVRVSQDENRKLRQVAEDLIAGRWPDRPLATAEPGSQARLLDRSQG